MKSTELAGNNNGQNNSQWDSLVNLEEDRYIKVGVTRLGDVDVLYDEQLKKAAGSFLNEEIMPISGQSIDELVKYSAHASYDEEKIRNELYNSAYDIRDLTTVEDQTNSILSRYENV